MLRAAKRGMSTDTELASLKGTKRTRSPSPELPGEPLVRTVSGYAPPPGKHGTWSAPSPDALPECLEKLKLPNGLRTVYSEFIFKTHYARLVTLADGTERREQWDEAVKRTIHALTDHPAIPDVLKVSLARALAGLSVLPSMRVLMTAGRALARENMCAFNCTYLPIDSIAAFSEVMYLLACGTGVGFSCEKSVIAALPEVPSALEPTGLPLVIEDSAQGWALGFREYLTQLWSGRVPTVDYSKIRPAGARLRIMGGRASGPAPFQEVIEFSLATLTNARGRKLSSLEVHELVCKTARAIVSGGVRRSSLISLSDLDDKGVAVCKSTADWYDHKPHLACSNNSAVFEGRGTEEEFFANWQLLVDSKSGERGLFNRAAARNRAQRHGRRKHEGIAFGTNPCGEVRDGRVF